MSKAFTRESDDVPEPPAPLRLSTLPPGAKNYLTPDGARRLQAGLDKLLRIERPEILSSPETSEARRTLPALDQRIFQLQQSLQTAVIVPAPLQPWQQVRFGATVTVRNSQGEEESYRIVGIDELDADRGWVSWLSPIAKALINAKLNERIRFQSPSGDEELEIVNIVYE